MTTHAYDLHDQLRQLTSSSGHQSVAAQLAPLLEVISTKALDDYLGALPASSSVDPAKLAQVKAAQSIHWRKLFSLTLNPDYAQSAQRMGQAWYSLQNSAELLHQVHAALSTDLVSGLSDHFMLHPGRRKSALSLVTQLLSVDLALMTQGVLVFVEQAQSRHMEKAQTTAREVAKAAQEAANAITQISDGAQVQIEVICDVGQSLTETRAVNQQIVDEAQRAAQRSTENATAVAVSQERVRDLVRMMDEIKATSATIGKLAEYAENIAEQTTLLAVNAAIQASKASSQESAGFSVVAAEVGKLADQSNASVQDITGIVKEAQRVADRGLEVTRVLEQEIIDLGVRSGEIRDLMAQVSGDVETQQSALSSVSQSMDQLQQIGTASNSAAEEIAATMFDLSRMAASTLRDVDEGRAKA